MKAGLTNSDTATRYAFLVSLMDGNDTVGGGPGDDNIEVGSGGTATITSGAGDDVVRVWHAKSLSLDGGAGLHDRLDFSAAFGNTPTPANGAVVDLTAHTGTNPFGGTITTITGVEEVFGTAKNDALTGDSADNWFDNGGAGNDTLKGEGGNDRLVMRLGTAATFTADGGAGTDSLSFDFSFAPSDTTPLTSVLDLNNKANNTGIFAHATVTGFETVAVGDFSFRFDQPNLGVEVRGTGIGETVNGGWGPDTLFGNAGNDVLTGLDGIDTLNGGAGNDTLDSAASSKGLFQGIHDPGADHIDGGADIDRAVVWRLDDTAGITLTIANPNATQTLADGTTIVRVERLDFYGGSGNDVVTGGALADTLGGNEGNDTLVGGAGADKMLGDQGSDTFVVDNAHDRVVEYAGRAFGTDKVLASVTYTLADNVEGLTLTGSANIRGTGNAGANTITGNAGSNTLDGRAGADRMLGGRGNDTYVVDSSGDTITESAGTAYGIDKVLASVTDTLANNVENLTLTGSGAIKGTGNTLANTIIGNSGANLLTGGLGSDTLSGLGGKDTFFFNKAISASNRDHIKDFKAVDDTIKLENSGSGLFTKLAAGHLHADDFATITSASAIVDPDARILYDKAHGALYYDPNGGSASGRVQFATLDNHTSLTHADFLVV